MPRVGIQNRRIGKHDAPWRLTLEPFQELLLVAVFGLGEAPLDELVPGELGASAQEVQERDEDAVVGLVPGGSQVV